MRTAHLVCRRCLFVAAPATLVAALLAGIALAAAGGEGAALAPFVHLPAFVATACCCAAALECWPTFAQRRPGADWLLQILPPPWFGCAAAAAGALLALLLLLLPLGAAAGLLAPEPHAHRRLQAIGAPILRPEQQELAFAAAGAPARAVLLRPVALLPAALLPVGAPRPTALQVVADDAPLLPEPVVIEGSQQLLRLPFAARNVHTLRVRRTAGNLPLVFPPGSVVLVGARPHARVANGALALLSYLLPGAATLACAVLAAPATALPVSWTLVLAALLLQTLGGFGPTGDAVAALLRGRWLLAEPLLRPCLPSLGTGLLAMILAMLVRRRLRR